MCTQIIALRPIREPLYRTTYGYGYAVWILFRSAGRRDNVWRIVKLLGVYKKTQSQAILWCSQRVRQNRLWFIPRFSRQARDSGHAEAVACGEIVAATVRSWTAQGTRATLSKMSYQSF